MCVISFSAIFVQIGYSATWKLYVIYSAGISNETSHIQSHDGAMIQHRTMSVSSSSHYSSSYSCGSRGEIPPPKVGHLNGADDIATYMQKAKV